MNSSHKSQRFYLVDDEKSPTTGQPTFPSKQPKKSVFPGLGWMRSVFVSASKICVLLGLALLHPVLTLIAFDIMQEYGVVAGIGFWMIGGFVASSALLELLYRKRPIRLRLV